jgi:hypothetical protein
MKAIFSFVALFYCLQLLGAETSLFDSKGKAVAYIAKDRTIYLWSGKLAAYIAKDGFNIYNFEGRHKGWYKNGIIYEGNGKAIGGIKAVFDATQVEPFKGFKEFLPFKGFKAFAPFAPNFQKIWADGSLKSFLQIGVDEISLFDSTGIATAYIDKDSTIYLWGGKPVAYVEDDAYNVFGFNGEHLGWFTAEMFFGRDGNVVGATKEAINNPKLEPLKGLKKLKPLKGLKRLKPLKPNFAKKWAKTPLQTVLLSGRK